MTVLVLLTIVAFGVAIAMVIKEKGFKRKSAVIGVFMAGMLFALSSSGMATNIRDGIVSGVDSAGNTIGSFFH